MSNNNDEIRGGKKMGAYADKDKEEDIEDKNNIINSWDELEIPPNLLRGIYAYGLEKPSPIQCKAIKPLVLKRDVIAQAQSGTGKTATFSIGGLSRVNLEENTTQVLVLSPTKELSTQTAAVMTGIGSVMEGLKIQIIVGGNSIDEDARKIQQSPPHVISGTPGRIYDMIRRNYLSLSKIKMVIMDEADELLSSGFQEQIYNIFQYLNKGVQYALFSATLPPYVDSIVNRIVHNPVRIIVKAEQLTLEGISQYYVAVEDDRQKYATLKDLYSAISMSQCIIYSNSVKRVVELYEAMMEDGFPVCRIHSGMDKEDRDIAFSDFRSGKYRVLISSNVTARGIDIQQVSVVINFDIPKDIHTYLHRIGRSGRWGRKGVGINLITRRDTGKLREIETHYACQVKELPINFDNLMR